jgi:hypothetical protein
MERADVHRAREVIRLNTFTAVFEQDSDWWVAYVEELPGANTQGPLWKRRARS